MGNMLTATWGGVFAKFHKVCQWQLVRIRLYSALAIQSGSYTISLSLCTTGSLIKFCWSAEPSTNYFLFSGRTPPPRLSCLWKPGQYDHHRHKKVLALRCGTGRWCVLRSRLQWWLLMDHRDLQKSYSMTWAAFQYLRRNVIQPSLPPQGFRYCSLSSQLLFYLLYRGRSRFK